MSLEQKIEALTEAVQRLTAVMQTAGGDETTTEPAKRTRRTKAEMEAARATEPAAAASAAPNTNTTGGVVYIHIPAHNTVAAINPGDPYPSIPGTHTIGESEYQSLKAKYTPVTAVGNGAATTVGAPAAAPAPTDSSAPSVTKENLLEKCKALHAKGGNPALESVLKQFSVVNVPGLLLLTDKYSDIGAALDAAVNPPNAALFG